MTVTHHLGVVDFALGCHRVLHRTITFNALVQRTLRVIGSLFADGQVLAHICCRSGLLCSPGIIRRCNSGLFHHCLLALSLNLRGFPLLRLRLFLRLHTLARQHCLLQLARLYLRVDLGLYHLRFHLDHRRRCHHRHRHRLGCRWRHDRFGRQHHQPGFQGRGRRLRQRLLHAPAQYQKGHDGAVQGNADHQRLAVVPHPGPGQRRRLRQLAVHQRGTHCGASVTSPRLLTPPC